MSTPPEVPGKRESLDTRIEFEERGRIDRAAKVRSIVTSREAYAEFMTRLDQPPQRNERLRKTMRPRHPGRRHDGESRDGEFELGSNAIADGMKTVTGKWYGADES